MREKPRSKPASPRSAPKPPAELHPRNRHRGRYDFPALIAACGEKPHSKDEPDRGAMACKPTLPDPEDPGGIVCEGLDKAIPFVEEDVTEASSTEHSDNAVGDEVTGIFFFAASALDLPVE